MSEQHLDPSVEEEAFGLRPIERRAVAQPHLLQWIDPTFDEAEPVLDEWVEIKTRPHGHVWDAKYCAACGSELDGCHGCLSMRCLNCYPYSDYERLNRCCVTTQRLRGAA